MQKPSQQAKDPINLTACAQPAGGCRTTMGVSGKCDAPATVTKIVWLDNLLIRPPLVSVWQRSSLTSLSYHFFTKLCRMITKGTTMRIMVKWDS